jgi:hypothetical protein
MASQPPQSKKKRLSGFERKKIGDMKKSSRGNATILSFVSKAASGSAGSDADASVLSVAQEIEESVEALDHAEDNDSVLQQSGACKQGESNDSLVDMVDDSIEHERVIDLNIDYPTDPYLFQKVPLTPRLIRAIIEAGPCQPGRVNDGYEFQTDEDGFQFKSNWYVKESKSGSVTRKWLVYSPRSDKMFCFTCMLLADRKDTTSLYADVWTNPCNGVSRFRKGLEKIKNHETSNVHIQAENELLLLKVRLSKDETVIHKLVELERRQIEENRRLVKRLIDVALFLAKQGLPFRGHREYSCMGTSVNEGNFLETCKLLSKYDAVLAKHISESKRNETYFSHTIQNEIIHAMAQETLKCIVNEVKESKYYSIIVDSTIDISKIDQFSLSVRYVNRNGHAQESFICFEELPGATADDFFEVLKDCVEHTGLDLSLCRGQAYDGASTMSGRISGLQAKVKQVSPNALYIHCCAHNLNLVLIDSVQSCTRAISFFGTLETLYTFLSGSLPRLHLLQEEQEKQMNGVILTLKRLSDTRWASHKRAVEAVHKSIPCIIDTLQKITDGDIPNTKAKTVSEANGLLSNMLNLEFMFLLKFWVYVLDCVHKLSEYLQNSTIDLITCKCFIDACFGDIIAMRNDNTFENIQQEAIELSKNCGGPEVFKDKRTQKKKRFFDEAMDDSVVEDARERFKIEIFYVLLDVFTNQLKDRFKDFSEVVQQFRVLDQKLFLEKSFNECKEELTTYLADMYESDLEKEDLFSEYKSF